MHSERVVQPLDTLRFVATAARDCERARARARHLGGSKGSGCGQRGAASGGWPECEDCGAAAGRPCARGLHVGAAASHPLSILLPTHAFPPPPSPALHTSLCLRPRLPPPLSVSRRFCARPQGATALAQLGRRQRAITSILVRAYAHAAALISIPRAASPHTTADNSLDVLVNHSGVCSHIVHVARDLRNSGGDSKVEKSRVAFSRSFAFALYLCICGCAHAAGAPR